MSVSESQKNYFRKKKKRKIIIICIQLSLTFIFLFLWEVLTKNNVLNSFIYSSPTRIVKQIIDLAVANNLISHILTTLKEVIIAFIISISLGFLISVIFYELPIIAKIFDPFLTVLNSLPKVALGPIIIIIAGANTKSIIIMAILINLIVSITTIYNGMSNVDPIKLKLFKTFNATKKDILFRLVVPSAYPSIIASLKLNIALTLIGVITGEFLVSQKGIGYLIIYGTQVFNLDLVMAGISILILLSFILYKTIVIIENKIIKESL